MQYFLAKTDPSTYSIEDFVREKETTWDGVRSAQAVKFLKMMKPGDCVFIYHSQGESAIVGVAQVVGNSRPDLQDARSWLVDFRLLDICKPPYITLHDLKKTGKFGNFRLIYQSRLSVMDVPDNVIAYLKKQGLSLP